MSGQNPGIGVLQDQAFLGWDAQAFKRSLGLQGKHVLLMISRLAGWKRVDRGITCVADLIHKRRRRDVVLLILGEGAKRNQLEELARNLGLSDAVRFMGGVSHSEVYRYFMIADVFLSLYDVSNLGNPLIEAMRFGKPVVTLRDGSTDFLLDDRVNARLVPPDRLTEALPECVDSLLDDAPQRKSLGEHVSRTFHENVVTWEERMKREEELIRRLVTGPRQTT